VRYGNMIDQLEILKRKFENVMSVNKSLTEENKKMDKMVMNLKREIAELEQKAAEGQKAIEAMEKIDVAWENYQKVIGKTDLEVARGLLTEINRERFIFKSYQTQEKTKPIDCGKGFCD
jgi:predicted nuclease with TOPRIM domain